jgi:hypothetical protein
MSVAFYYYYAECHYAECRCAECRSAFETARGSYMAVLALAAWFNLCQVPRGDQCLVLYTYKDNVILNEASRVVNYVPREMLQIVASL